MRRERLWRRFVDDILFELDNPTEARARREREERERAGGHFDSRDSAGFRILPAGVYTEQ